MTNRLTRIAFALFFAVMVNAFAGDKKGVYFEAEWARSIELNYQIEDDGKRVYLISDEGADGAFAWQHRSHTTLDLGEAHYSVNVPVAGKYALWAKRYWMDSCGNSAFVSVNNGPFRVCWGADDSSSHLFGKWRWGIMAMGDFKAGTASIKLRVCEDGPRFDAFALLPPGQTPDDEDLKQAKPTFDDKQPSPFAMSVAMPTSVIAEKGALAVTLYVRRLHTTTRKGQAGIVFPDGKKIEGGTSQSFEFKDGEVLKKLSFKLTFPEDTTRGEHRIRALVKGADEKVCGLKTFTVLKPLDWKLLGPLAFDSALDAAAFSAAPDLKKWQAYPEKGYDRFATMDLEGALGDSLSKSAYVYTEIHSDTDKPLALLVNNDDQAFIWINGKLAYSDETMTPAIGGLTPKKITLKKGRNRILAKVTQSDQQVQGRENYWRLRIRFRKWGSIRRLAPVRGEMVK